MWAQKWLRLKHFLIYIKTSQSMSANWKPFPYHHFMSYSHKPGVCSSLYKALWYCWIYPTGATRIETCRCSVGHYKTICSKYKPTKSIKWLFRENDVFRYNYYYQVMRSVLVFVIIHLKTFYRRYFLIDLFYKNYNILFIISLGVSRGLITKSPALVQVMLWRGTIDGLV